MSTNRIVLCLSRNGSIIALLFLVCSLFGERELHAAQVSGSSSIGTSITSAGTPDLVSGTVINASTGQPVRRALVRLNTRAVLTDSEGKFRFEENTEPNANVLASKPGFYSSPEYGDAGNLYLQSSQLAAPLEIRLYPESLLTGVVLTPDGTPLPKISVSAMRSVYDNSGHRWISVGQKETDSHGRFRLPVPAGEYRLQTQYSPQDQTTGEAVLPVVIPNGGSSSQVIRIHSGEEQTFEIRPPVSPVHTVGLSPSGPDPGFMRISAHSRSGGTLQLNSMTPIGGGTRVQLPQGTFTITAKTMVNRDAAELAETTVTIPDHDISGLVLQFSPIPSIPVELLVESASNSESNPPGLLELGLSLQSAGADSDGGSSMLNLVSRPNQTFSFQAVPGSYRLAGRNNTWYVKSATYGDADLLSQELTVAPGVSGTPIRVVVSNQTGGLQGTVKLNGNPAAAYVYLIANGPNVQAEYNTRSSATGGYSFAHLPPGSYQVIAFERRHSADYHDPEALSAFSGRVHSVTIDVSDTSTLNLDAVPEVELIP